MSVRRRAFLLWTTGAAAAALAKPASRKPEPENAPAAEANQVGCLADTTLCIGCRKCEEACNARNGLPRPEAPFADRTVFRAERRPSPRAFTVVNEYPGAPSRDQFERKQTYVKVQCLHCLTPACVSACIVGAMKRAPDGAIVYRPEICLGCRYCMVACPFQIPAYEYSEAVKPRVRKCEFCSNTGGATGANPACAAACPTEALVFGKRESLLALARDRIKKRPDRYLDRIYGESEIGGTSWLYLIGRKGPEVGLIDVPKSSPARRTEAILHGIFRYGIIPVAFYGALGAVMWRNQRKDKEKERDKDNGAAGSEGRRP